MINVTKPFFPPIGELEAYLRQIWKREWITNNGPLVIELEDQLKKYLGVEHLLFLGNGTIALQIAIKALSLRGEIITTPFSYVATTSSIVWENCTPVFADIDPESLNIDPKAIEAAITKNTTAILATHVFGNACDIEAIQEIADRHELKVIYDAAHCFGTLYKGKSIFAYGDISTASFHATKLFHTAEGGAIVTNSPEVWKRVDLMRNFGHAGFGVFEGVGVNGKNSEIHAALGLVNLKYMDGILAKRKELSKYYDEKLKSFDHQKMIISKNTTFNHAYYPVIFETESQLLRTMKALNDQDIHPRRYFYPSLNTLSYVESRPAPVSESISKRVLCLPLYDDLLLSEIDMISSILMRMQNEK